MNFTQLRGLIALAETGRVTAAAERIGVTQSGLSQALAALEEELGIKLLVRQRNGVALTAFGERALDHARSAFSHIEALRREATKGAGEETGSIRIAAFPSVFATVLPPLIWRFRVLYPDIDLTLLEADDREVEAWLVSGSVDLCVVGRGHEWACPLSTRQRNNDRKAGHRRRKTLLDTRLVSGGGWSPLAIIRTWKLSPFTFEKRANLTK